MAALTEKESMMDWSSHIPGPWLVYVERPESLGHTVYHVANHVETSIALRREDFWSPDDPEPPTDDYGYLQSDENADIAPHLLGTARLIAAAPDLLAALRDAVARYAPLPYEADCGVIVAARAAIAKAEGQAS